jgi:shikimate dehydrogenase
MDRDAVSAAIPTAQYALLGLPTGHSPTPALWSRLFADAGRDAAYRAHDVEPADLARWVAALRDGALAGAHVTMPHKRPAAQAADVRDAQVRRVGVANWLAREDGALVARNTDVEGARRLLGDRRFGRVLLLGSGGAARAVLGALHGAAGTVAICSADPDGAAELAALGRPWFEDVVVAPWARRAEAADGAGLVVNATPLGMAGVHEGTPLEAAAFTPSTFLYDLVYRRDGAPTALQQAATGVGAPVVDGLGHLEAQAVACLPYMGLDAALAPRVGSALTALIGRPPRRWEDAA